MKLDISQVMALLPHRYPFLLIDRVVEIEPGQSLSAIKNVTINEPFFQGHFPNQPIMPGVLILEAMAQATGLLAFADMGDEHESKLYMLVGIDKSRFRGQVVPGDQLLLNISLKRNMRGIGLFSCQALVAGEVVAEAEMMCSAQERQA
ncbi:MAG: 3-hydroxyacyl-[acyl-carrier-protein] dehydratase, FabZ form (EC 4.2.1.59) [Olavius algarvensis Gamma 3 endosymbiont]|nr:MAG: 3-hydroxyacyl-[acyl-carrier-protein] dehydratase, FabZ form (EC 4.2.1.59) [Olavius algarvensis Gamma 3 endosymbiont]